MAVHAWGGSLCSLRLFSLPRHDGRTVCMGSHQIRTAVPETAGIQIREPVLFLHGKRACGWVKNDGNGAELLEKKRTKQKKPKKRRGRGDAFD